MFKKLSLLGKAYRTISTEMWISLLVLLVLTVILSCIMYVAEHAHNPDYLWSDALIWSVVKYVQDPAEIVSPPATITGQVIGTIVGLIAIAIFVVPTGLIGTGFSKVVEDDKREKELKDFKNRIRRSFKRLQDKETHYRLVPRSLPIITLQAKKTIAEKDIIETVSKFDEFRLHNLATSQVASEHPQDRLVIEMLPLDKKTVDGFDIVRKDYGIMIDRQSNVTIIAPTAATENSIGHFAYYLAQFGGFNYVSREFVTDVDEPVSYLTIEGNEDEWEAPLKNFVNDVSELSKVKDHWNIILASSDNVFDTQFHFIHRAIEKSELEFTTLDESRFQEFYTAFSEKMKAENDYMSDMDEKYRPVGKKNIGVIAGGGTENNAITLRVSYSVTTWTDRPAPIIVDMAKIIKQYLEAPEHRTFEENPSWKTEGWGYGCC